MILKNVILTVLEFFTSAFSKERFKEFLNDNSGGLVLSFGDVDFHDADWMEYKMLKPDMSVKSVNPDDLPDDFCEEACRLVDEFHRKTVNENVEWMLYFDYTTGEVVYCWKGKNTYLNVHYKNKYVLNKNIVSIHNHPRGVYSFPSPENFGILENEFEDYEIITSIESFWLIEFKGRVGKDSRKLFQQDISENMFSLMSSIKFTHSSYEINKVTEEIIKNYLLDNLNIQIQGITLFIYKKELK